MFLIYWSPAAVVYPLRDLMRCVFRDALLHTTVVMCGYLCCRHPPVSFDQAGPSPRTSLINKAFLPTELLDVCCFFCNILCKLQRPLCAKIPGAQQFLRYSNHPVLHRQSATSACLYASSSRHMIGWLNICVNKLVYVDWELKGVVCLFNTHSFSWTCENGVAFPFSLFSLLGSVPNPPKNACSFMLTLE